MIPLQTLVHDKGWLAESGPSSWERPARTLANHTGLPLQRVKKVCAGKGPGPIDSTTELLAVALSAPPEFWAYGQSKYDLTQAHGVVEAFVQLLLVKYRP